MILLDTDHVTVLKYPASERCLRLVERLEAAPASETFGVSVISVEEQMRGWLAAIAKERAARRQVPAYRELTGLFDFWWCLALTSSFCYSSQGGAIGSSRGTLGRYEQGWPAWRPSSTSAVRIPTAPMLVFEAVKTSTSVAGAARAFTLPPLQRCLIFHLAER